MMSKRFMRKKVREYYDMTGKEWAYVNEILDYMYGEGNWGNRERHKLAMFLVGEGVKKRKVSVRSRGRGYYKKNMYKISEV